MESKSKKMGKRPISLSPACDGQNPQMASAFETWGQLLGGLFLIGAGMRQNSFTGGIVASIGSCLVYRGAACLYGSPQGRRQHGRRSERPDPAVVDNPIDEASWESFPASDSPVFSGITK
jgi:hypothetical protein